jgi:hypothetical protein
MREYCLVGSNAGQFGDSLIFRKNISAPFLGLNMMWLVSKKPAEAGLTWLTFRPWRWGRHVPLKHQVPSELHGSITQKDCTLQNTCYSWHFPSPLYHLIHNLIKWLALLFLCMCKWVTLRSFQYPDYIASIRRIADKMERIWKELVKIQWRYYISNCLEKLKKILSGQLVSWMRFELSTSWILNYCRRNLLNFTLVVIKAWFTVQLSWLMWSMVFLSSSTQMLG